MVNVHWTKLLTLQAGSAKNKDGRGIERWCFLGRGLPGFPGFPRSRKCDVMSYSIRKDETCNTLLLHTCTVALKWA